MPLVNIEYLTEDEIQTYEKMKTLGHTDERPIGFTAYIWHELPFNRVNTSPLAELLNEKINLLKYGSSIELLGTAFVIYPSYMEDSNPSLSLNEYHPKEKVVAIEIIVNYEKLLIDTNEQAFERIKKSYYKGIKEILPTLNIPDFNIDEFITDLKKVLF